MTRKNWLAVGVIGGFLFFLAIVSYLYLTPVKDENRRVNISVVVYGSSTGRWISFKQGVDQAASDLGAIVNFVPLTGMNDSQEQEEQIDREMENGAEGIVAAVTDSRGMADYISRTANVIPVVLAENRIEGNESLTCVAANAYEMGQELARQVIEETDAKIPVNVIRMSENKSSQQERLAGFQDECEAAGRPVKQVIYPNRESMGRLLASSEEQVLAVTDDRGLEMTVNILRDAKKNISIYGIGSSENIVSALDQGMIEGIVFQNEFNMGYESVKLLIQKIRKGGSDEPMEIDYHQASVETLHEPENERLLYPIVQ